MKISTNIVAEGNGMTQRIFVGNQNLQEIMESLVSTIFEAKKTEAGEISVTLLKTTSNLKVEIEQ